MARDPPARRVSAFGAEGSAEQENRRRSEMTVFMKTLTQWWVLVAFAGFGVAASIPGFKVTKKYPIPGDGGFDYIFFDDSSNRLYVSHGKQVDVLDADSGKLLGK